MASGADAQLGARPAGTGICWGFIPATSVQAEKKMKTNSTQNTFFKSLDDFQCL